MREPTRDAILSGIGKLRARWTRVAFLSYLIRALFYALLLSAVVVLVTPTVDRGPLFAGLCALCIGVALVAALYRRPSNVAVAKAYDDTADLKDRVSSSLELIEEEGAMVDALLAESAGSTGRVEPARVFPFTLPREGWWLPLPALLLAAVLFLPGFLSAEPAPDPHFEETLETRIAALEDLISHQSGQDPSERQKKLIEELQELKAQLSREKVDKKDALAELSKLIEELERERTDELQKRKELEELIKKLTSGDKDKKLAQSLQNGDYQEALNRLKELSKELKKKLEKLRKEGKKEELADLEEKLKKLQELKAKLLNLLNINLDLGMMTQTIDFLSDFEGDLAEIEDLEFAEFLDIDCKCDKPGT